MTGELASLLQEKGGILDPAKVPGPPGNHLQRSRLLFEMFFRSISLPGEGGGIDLTPPSRIARFEFVNRWDVNASAVLVKEGPVVLFHAGVAFCLYDYFNQLLANPKVLSQYDCNGELEAGRLIPRYDFSHLLDTQWPDNLRMELPSFVYWDSPSYDSQAVRWLDFLEVKPRSKERKEIVSEAYKTAMLFLFLHEQSHIENGHLEYLRRQTGELSLCEFAGRGRSNCHDRQAIEIDADRSAAVRTFLPEISLVLKRREVSIGLMERTCHLHLFAIGATLLLIEHQMRNRASKLDRILKVFLGKPSPTHPSGATRVWGCVQAVRDSIESESIRDIFDSIVPEVLVDLDKLSGLLGLKAEELRYDRVSGAHWNLQASLKSLQPHLKECATAKSDRYFVDGVLTSRHVVSGNAYVAMNDPEQAMREYRNALSGDIPDSVRVQALLGAGIAAKKMALPDVAIDFLRKAIDIDEKNGRAFSILASALLAQGKIEDATGAIRRGLQADPAYPLLWFRWGMLHRGVDDYEFKGGIEQALRLSPEEPLFLAGAATLNADSGEYEKALEIFDKVIASGQMTELAREGRIRALNAMGRNEEATAERNHASETSGIWIEGKGVGAED